MTQLTIGARVRLNEIYKQMLIVTGCQQHVDEFGDQCGTIIGYTYPDTDEWLDVRWDSGIRFGYNFKQLRMADDVS